MTISAEDSKKDGSYGKVMPDREKIGNQAPPAIMNALLGLRRARRAPYPRGRPSTKKSPLAPRGKITPGKPQSTLKNSGKRHVPFQKGCALMMSTDDRGSWDFFEREKPFLRKGE